MGCAMKQTEVKASQVEIVREPVFHIIIRNLFGKELNQKILGQMIKLKDKFIQAEITLDGGKSGVNTNYRKNLTCYVDNLYVTDQTVPWDKRRDIRKGNYLLSEVDRLIEQSFLRSFLGNAPSPVCFFEKTNNWETQVSRYGKEDFYKWHVDGDGIFGNRFTTMIYYFFKTPAKFTGGTLKLTNGMMINKEIIGSTGTVEIQPENDMLVIFGSRSMHCVTPVKNYPKAFGDGRFSANIWLRNA